MGSLRWILLLAGLVFLAGLAAWELHRPRQARRDGDTRSERGDADMAATGSMDTVGAAAEAPSASAARMYAGASLSGGRSRTAPPTHVDLPPLELPENGAAALDTGRQIAASAIIIDEPIHALGPPAGDASEAEPYYVYARSEAPAGPSVQPPLPGDAPLAGDAPRPAVVDWPPESERHIISLRVAALGHERLSGRVVRQALGACGFEHGRFGIFHQPGADGRALLSAANLAKPGLFDLQNMDFQRFSGLSLFAVLPGPLPPAAALDHLLDTAQDLAERLRARLQDEQGLTLGAAQLETLRRTVQDLTAAALPAEPTA
jgi:FtsZ-interacting cell division protein ZipA